MKTKPTLIALAIGMAAPMAWSRDVDYDFVVCTHSKHTVLEANADLVALGTESWGTVATSATKEFDKATTHCVGYLRMVAGKGVGKGMCKWFNNAGDTAIGEWEMPEAGENTWKWLAGTGGLKGIVSVKSSFASLGNGKAAESGTSQGCRRDWGTYRLPN
ncbi:MAG TPA: hypothetical protein VGE16_10185 [Albitalea sp.]